MEATAAVVERPASFPSSPVTEPASAAPGPGASDPPTGKGTNETIAMSTATATAAPATAHALAGQLVTNSTQASEPTTTTAPTATAPTATSAANAPTVNTAATASAAMMMTSSAMTPTTTNYSLNAQLAKATSTLTPMGEDKVSTAGPIATNKGKQTKKKADGEAAAKKPSPRARAKADPGKAEKRKASPARSNAKNEASTTATPTNGAGVAGAPSTMAGMPTTSQPSGATPTPTSSALGQGYPPMGENLPTDLQQQQLLPSQDTELRRMYLQRIYRQLQMTHRNQDDTMVRRLATNIEIDICRRASTRPEYVALMNQHINSLMQAELTNGTIGFQSSLYVPGVAIQTTSSAVNVPASAGATMVPNGLSQTSVSAYKQASTPIPGGSEMAQRAPTPTQGSFMSLLSGQAPMQSFDASRSQHQYGLQDVPAAQMRQPPYNAPSYQAQAQGLGQAQDVKTDLHGELAQQQYTPQRQPTQLSPTSAPPDFVAQFQRLDRNGLLDLLWTQHRTVVQYQRRLAQLEVQLNLRHTSSAGITGNIVSTSTDVASGYYTASAGQPPIPSVPPTVTAEAEAQRARERANSRAAHQSSQYGQAQYPPNQAPSTPHGVVNPQLYWEKVRYLKESYLRYLYVAHQALSQHSAPANSAQGLKAENVKHNIALASTILNEAPTAVQPRPLEVLDSIERFIQSTVVPIVRKVSPQNPAQTTPGQPQHMLSQQNASDLNDPMRGAGGAPPGYQPSPTPTSSFGVGLSNGTPPPAPATTASPVAAAKSTTKAATTKGAKSTGKKSPSGSSKKTTPKASGPTAPKAASKVAGKKNPGRAGGVKQSAKTVNGPSPAPDQTAVQVAADVVHAAPVADNSPRNRSQTATMKSSAIPDNDLNDFSDFADLDFDVDLQDPLLKVPSNKENASGGNSRKRSIEDV